MIELKGKIEMTPAEVIRCCTWCKCDEYEGPFLECTYEGDCYYRNCMDKLLAGVTEKETIEYWKNINSTKEIVRIWRKSNPKGKKLQCHADTGLSRSTIDRYWDLIQEGK